MRRSVSSLLVPAVHVAGLVTAGPAMANHTFVVKKETRFNSHYRKAKNVRCPEGSERIGGGAHVDGARRGVALETNRPIANGWRGVAVETKPNFDKDWKLVVRAVCEQQNGVIE